MRRSLVVVILVCSIVFSGCSFRNSDSGVSSAEAKLDNEEAFGLDYNNVQAIKDMPYKIKASSTDFEWTLLEKDDKGIEYSTDVEIEKKGKELIVTGTKPGVSVIRLERGTQVLDEITFYTLECEELSDAQKNAVKAITDGKIDTVAIDDGITSDYVDLIQQKLVLSSLPSVRTYAVVGDKSYWIEIEDLKSRIYYAFYNALNRLKSSDFSLYYPVTRLKYDAVMECEDNLFAMLPHLRGSGIEGGYDCYRITIDYKSLDNKELPDLVIERSV